MDLPRKIRHLGADWRRTGGVIGVAALYGIGARIVAPNINGDVIAEVFKSGGAGPLLRVYDWLVGGGVSHGAVLAIGIMPYLSARIFLWLARVAVPSVAEMANQDGGHARLRRWTRGLTFGLALVQSYGFARFVESIRGAVVHPGAPFIVQTMAVLTAAAMCVTWVSERLSASDDRDVPAGVDLRPPSMNTIDVQRIG